MFSSISFRSKLIASYSLILGLMLIVTITVIVSIRSLSNNLTWVEHTHEVLADAAQLEAAAVDMETGMRGYLLAGKQAFLEPYDNGSRRFTELVNLLSSTVADNPAQVQLLAEISDTIAMWRRNVTEPNIALRREIGDAQTMNDMAALIKQARGKHYFDQFRQQMAT